MRMQNRKKREPFSWGFTAEKDEDRKNDGEECFTNRVVGSEKGKILGRGKIELRERTRIREECIKGT